MAKHKQYSKPPLLEVFTEFLFTSGERIEWDAFLVPKFFQAIKQQYPNRHRFKRQGIEVRMPNAGAGPDVKPVGLALPDYRFTTEDEKTLIQLGENLLVVNQLPPYYGWERYEPRILEAIHHYCKLWKPAGISRVAVHYIDKIDLPEIESGLEKYFNLLPILPDYPMDPATNIAMSYEVPGATPGDILVVSMKQHASTIPDGMTFLFQWDYVATGAMMVTGEVVQSWLAAAHDFLHKTFESTFTDECRKLFE